MKIENKQAREVVQLVLDLYAILDDIEFAEFKGSVRDIFDIIEEGAQWE